MLAYLIKTYHITGGFCCQLYAAICSNKSVAKRKHCDIKRFFSRKRIVESPWNRLIPRALFVKNTVRSNKRKRCNKKYHKASNTLTSKALCRMILLNITLNIRHIPERSYYGFF